MNMNEQFDVVNLLKDKKALIKYIIDMITSSDFNGNVGEMMVKMGCGEDALKAMFDAKLKGG